MKQLLKEYYGLELLHWEKSAVGAGSDTYFITCAGGKYVVKYPASSEINHPEAEPELCEYLLARDIPACRFLRNKEGHFLTAGEDGRQFHVQRFIGGKMYELNTAPDWLMTESAQMLGKIHTALRDYPGLPIGIGSDFFKYMTPERALESYKKSLQIAERQGDLAVAEDLRYRIGLMQRLPAYEFDLDRLTCRATHGDYFISQILCGEGKINAVIDWTTACVHPVVWEIMRSYVYAAPSCKEGQIDIDEFLRYVAAYREFAPLTEYDLLCMARLFYYQIAVCDYYGQYFASTADNRHIYLHQAMFSTKLLRWFETHAETLTAKLLIEGEILCSINSVVRFTRKEIALSSQYRSMYGRKPD